jgi:hypothetical protein
VVLSRTLVRGAVATSAAALPLLVTATPASAFESYTKDVVLEHTFTDSAGDPVTCNVEYTSSLFREDSNSTFRADTSTQAYTFDPLLQEACRAFALVDTVYRDPEGHERHARAFGTEIADLQLDEVQGTYQSTHEVFFINCAENCQASYTTSPK